MGMLGAMVILLDFVHFEGIRIGPVDTSDLVKDTTLCERMKGTVNGYTIDVRFLLLKNILDLLVAYRAILLHQNFKYGNSGGGYP